MELLGFLLWVTGFLRLNSSASGVGRCSLEEFTCTAEGVHHSSSGSCVSLSVVCDGWPDCPNGADERLEECGGAKPGKPKSCSSPEFSCSNGQCVPHSWRCDHSRDCEDGSDEDNCSQNECEVNNGGCSHVCLDLPLGFVCDCPPGMRLVQDTHCEEVDPCLDRDVCDQLCVQSSGSLTCECEEGYLKTSESGRCLATGDAAGLVFSSSAGIGWMSSSGSDQRKISDSTGAAGPLAASLANSTLYWSNPEHTGVYRLSLADGDQTPAVLFEGTRGIVGLAVDWVHELLYWTSNHTRALHVSSLNGSEQHRALITGLTRPAAVAVQPLLRLLFWADGGVSPRIEQSSLDGMDRKALVTSIIRNPVSICLDIPRGLLYWADSGLHTISRVRYDGQHRKTVVESNGYLDEPFGLAVFEGRVYWSDQVTGSICSADKHNGRSLRVTQNAGTRFPAGLLIYHPLIQPTGAVLSPAEPDADAAAAGSASPWILSLIVFLCILLAVLLLCWRRSDPAPTSTLMDSQDPLVPSAHAHTHPDKDGTCIDLSL
ncbi:low-density lipoprotein receptor-related protein 8-like [Colossoma macropomum]|uniref:low-density lipoprotein receptor-related protein 8-like n=1 Tax=Colossoma macropomum TaxID=42526 RepID=UPI0018643776|nr:low-density lipoprotein receptor-related protein 8-like [Colossoma macropomum]